MTTRERTEMLHAAAMLMSGLALAIWVVVAVVWLTH